MTAPYETLYQLWKRKEQERRDRERWLATPELVEAMRRYPLVTPETALKAHRDNPKGGAK